MHVSGTIQLRSGNIFGALRVTWTIESSGRALLKPTVTYVIEDKVQRYTIIRGVKQMGQVPIDVHELLD